MAGVEAIIAATCCGPLPVMGQVLAHLVGSGGKRLRPMLSLLAGRASGVPSGSAQLVAAVAEMVHTASLLHDDVVDQPELRRGRPAAPRLFGNTVCVLSGDALLAGAIALLARLERPEPMATMATCVRRMALGEMRQLARIGQPHPSLLSYLQVAHGKTASLFAWCTAVGRLSPEAYGDALVRFGRRLGLAFQIADDVLDYTGDAARTGKKTGADLREGKFTLPLQLACQARPELLDEVARIRHTAAAEQAGAIDALVQQVVATGSPQQALAMAETLLRRAHRALDTLPPSAARDHLHLLADTVVYRSR